VVGAGDRARGFARARASGALTSLGRVKRILGRNGTPRVVRQRATALHTTLIVAGILIGTFALYVVYELGRYNAGYDRQAVAQQRTELEVKMEHLDKANRELRTQLAELETIRVGRAREQAEVARSMGELQAQVARQSQELAFYRGVVAQGATSVGVKIEQLRITPGPHPSSFIVHMALVRSGRADASATGTVALSLDGASADGARTLDLATLSAGKQHELRYNFHYLESFDQELALPSGFKPERLNVEVRSSRHEVAPLSQTFLWSVETSP
jgi:hypothetical protein